MIDIDALNRAIKAKHAVRITIDAMRPLLILTCVACVCATVLVILGNAGAQIVGSALIVGLLLFFCGTYARLMKKDPDSLGVEITITPTDASTAHYDASTRPVR